MIITALGIALIARSFVLIAALSPLRLRDDLDINIHLICLGLALACVPVFDMTIRNALAAAFIADVFVHLRELLDLLSDLCKTLILTRGQRRR